MDFRTDNVFDALRAPLALVDDPERREAFERYVEAARFPLERAVFDLLSGLVAGVNEQVGSHYRLRLAYQPGALSLEVEPLVSAGAGSDSGPEITFTDGDLEKITIRIPAELKDLATQAAGSAGISANSWFVRTLARALRGVEDDGVSRDEARAERRARRHALRMDAGIPDFELPDLPDWPVPPPGPGRTPGRRLTGWISD